MYSTIDCDTISPEMMFTFPYYIRFRLISEVDFQMSPFITIKWLLNLLYLWWIKRTQSFVMLRQVGSDLSQLCNNDQRILCSPDKGKLIWCNQANARARSYGLLAQSSREREDIVDDTRQLFTCARSPQRNDRSVQAYRFHEGALMATDLKKSQYHEKLRQWLAAGPLFTLTHIHFI